MMDKEILIGFLEEAMGYLPAIRQGIEDYFTDATRLDALEEAHRLMHTIKGASSMVGFADLSHVAHAVEEMLDEMLAGQRTMDEETAINILTTLDEIESSLNELSKETLLEAAIEHASATEGMTMGVVAPEEHAVVSSSFTEPSPIAESSAAIFEDAPIDPEMLEVFAEEAEDHLRTMSVGLSALDRNLADRAALQEVRRSTHTLKGAAGVVGFRTLAQLAHRMEDLLDRLFDGGINVTPDHVSLLLATTEVLEHLTQNANSKPARMQIEGLYARYATILSGAAVASPAGITITTDADAVATESTALAPLPEEQFIDLTNLATLAAESVPPETEDDDVAQPQRAARRVVRVPLDRLDDLVKLVSELVISRTVFEQRMTDLGREVDELHHSTERLQRVSTRLETEYEASSLSGSSQNPFAALPELKKIGLSFSSLPGSDFSPSALTGARSASLTPAETHGFDELEFDRYTEFHRISRELAETSSDTNAVGNELQNLLGDFDHILNRQRRLTSEIQEKLMRVRMVPLTTLATRLHRTIRVAAGNLGKHADLLIEGEQIELDTTVLDQMADPLLHLLRNAVGHGIEAAAARRTAGKPERGAITLRAYHEGTQVVIEVADDGAGINPQALRAKAVSGGFVASHEAAAMSDREAFALIFLPGLSTAGEINEVSGRGVGMDIVKDAVGKLQGTLTLDSVPGKGTTFTVRLPMTLAVTRALMVKAHGETFAIPLSAVGQILRVEPGDIENLSNEPVIRANGKIHPVIRLGEALGLRGAADESLRRLPCLVLNVNANQVALVVDEVIEGREVVIKSLGNHLRRVRGLMGATLMGDGRVIPILNPVDLVSRETTAVATASSHHSPRVAGARRTTTVMIVDDSPSVRRVTSNMIKGNGWQFLTAKDGLDALETLQIAAELPHVILLDVEMPRMDGY
ncbi:MAG: Hpt domain-containing protein, partial [Acidobacteriota bacterium]|nr:Hpt domain-containing protein [Acidobacteriota bacterium]